MGSLLVPHIGNIKWSEEMKELITEQNKVEKCLNDLERDISKVIVVVVVNSSSSSSSSYFVL